MDLADNFKKSNFLYHIFLLVISLNTKYTYFQLKCHVVIVLVPASHVSYVSPFSSYRLAPLKIYVSSHRESSFFSHQHLTLPLSSPVSEC